MTNSAQTRSALGWRKLCALFFCPGFRWRFISFAFFVSLLSSTPLFANDLEISNVRLTSQNATANTVKVQFNLAWENSWRNNTNYDAAWVFVKYSADSGQTWQHATLKTAGTNPSGFSGGLGTTMTVLVPSDKKGAFVYRSSNGYGNITNSNVQLVWDYNADGLADSTSVQVKVIGLEMVYVPETEFSVGDATNDGSVPTGGFFDAGTSYAPLSISGESALTLGSSSSGYLTVRSGVATSDDFGSGATQTLPGEFPKGYNAFFIMKHEITQGEWVNFFNTLSDTEKINRDITGRFGKNTDDTSTNRNTVSWPDSGNASVERPERACNYLLWDNFAAFADWAALRPMTELEFEKAARGPVTPKDLEYAWGNTRAVSAGDISGTEDGTETVTTENANAVYNNISFNGADYGSSGPLRVGIFATRNKIRWEAGASYYGVTDLSGNVWEQVVSVGSSQGRTFAGSHGDGVLSTESGYEGSATNTDWPGINEENSSRGVTGDIGSGLRGGSWEDSSERLRVADRYHINTPCDGGGNCNDFTDDGQGTCEGNIGCSWGNCSNCDVFTDESSCGGASGCSWGEAGSHNCSDHTAAGQVTCESSTGCTWHIDGDCSQISNSGECTSLSGCSWDDSECSNYNGNEENCGTAPGCSWDTSNCSDHNGNEGICSSTAGCTWVACSTWDGNSTECENNGCTFTAGNNCASYIFDEEGCNALNPACTWETANCSVFNGNQSSCDSTTGCTWDAVDCSAFNGSVCNDSANCASYSGCTFDSVDCSTWYGNSSSCTASCGCTWCADVGDESSCNGVGCTWNYSDCADFNNTDQGTCEGNSGCSWSDPNCSGQYNTSCSGGGGDTNVCIGTHYPGTCSGTHDPNTCSGTYETGTCVGNYGCTGDYCTGEYDPGTCSGTYEDSCQGNYNYCDGTYYDYSCTGSYDCSCSGAYGSACDTKGYGGRCVRTAP